MNSINKMFLTHLISQKQHLLWSLTNLFVGFRIQNVLKMQSVLVYYDHLI